MKRIIAFVLCMIFAFLCCSCSRQSDEACFDILCELLQAVNGEIGGDETLYSSSAEEGELGYFSDELSCTLFGEKWVTECFPKIEDCALYISVREIEEVAVFRCYSRSDTDIIAAMCLERADKLKVAQRSISNDDLTQTAHVEIRGRYVLFSFMSRSEAIAEYFYKLT